MLDSEEELEKEADGQCASVGDGATRGRGVKGHLLGQEAAGFFKEILIPLPAETICTFHWISLLAHLKAGETLDRMSGPSEGTLIRDDLKIYLIKHLTND